MFRQFVLERSFIELVQRLSNRTSHARGNTMATPCASLRAPQEIFALLLEALRLHMLRDESWQQLSKLLENPLLLPLENVV